MWMSLLVELIVLNWKYNRELINFAGGHWRYCVNFTAGLHYIQFADVELRFFEPIFLSVWISLSKLRGINIKITRDILGVVVFVFCMMWMCHCWSSPLFPVKSISERSLKLLAGIDVTAWMTRDILGVVVFVFCIMWMYSCCWADCFVLKVSSRAQ